MRLCVLLYRYVQRCLSDSPIRAVRENCESRCFIALGHNKKSERIAPQQREAPFRDFSKMQENEVEWTCFFYSLVTICNIRKINSKEETFWRKTSPRQSGLWGYLCRKKPRAPIRQPQPDTVDDVPPMKRGRFEKINLIQAERVL